ncbi:hypothetical protein N7465_001193 [Penicillium sp. CMV-2018d]|nr:hypothetical protein N7465_001193 [Penicillium sp. CMV-2018d]
MAWLIGPLYQHLDLSRRRYIYLQHYITEQTHYPKHVVAMSDHPIPAPTDRQLELLTQLRQAASNRSHARRRLLREASQLMRSANLIIDSYTNGGMAPSAGILWAMEQHMMSLVDEMWVVRAEERFYRDLEAEIFRGIGQ